MSGPSDPQGIVPGNGSPDFGAYLFALDATQGPSYAA